MRPRPGRDRTVARSVAWEVAIDRDGVGSRSSCDRLPVRALVREGRAGLTRPGAAPGFQNGGGRRIPGFDTKDGL
jgi:hypothetical protein